MDRGSEFLAQIEPALEYIDGFWDQLVANARGGHHDRMADWATLASQSRDGHLDDQDPRQPYILYLPNNFVTPGGRFMVQFYWDSYFAILGLVRSDRIDLARGMVENCFFLIKRHGMVIANRKRWAAGSQLPFLSSMVKEIYERTRDFAWLRNAVNDVEIEYRGHWLNQDHLVNGDLSRYHAPSTYPTEAIAAITIDHEASWDLSPRFDEADVLHLLPIDLNANLYGYEKDLAFFHQELGNRSLAQEWDERAASRLNSINNLLWNENEGLYFDYDFVLHQQKPIKSLATFFPLYFGLASQEQANRVREHLSLFEREHGMSTCDQPYGYIDRQWNEPIGWAPLHWVTYQALSRYGFDEDAERIARKWLGLNFGIWERTGAFFEKYDVVQGSEHVLTDRYENQEGFAWTNGVFKALADEMRKRCR